MDRPLTQPDRHFAKLAAYRFALEALADRYPSQDPNFAVLAEAVHALDRAAVHFTGEPLWFTRAGNSGGHMPHTGPIPPLQD